MSVHILGMGNATTGFEILYRRHCDDVLRFAFWLCGHRADAEDVCAETFARAYAGADGLRAESVKAYLLAIARNLVFERARRQRRETRIDDNLFTAEPGPEQRAGAGLEMRRVLAALAKLAEPDRAALLMQSHHGLDHRAIAGILGLTVAAVKVRIHRARLRLALSLEESP